MNITRFAALSAFIPSVLFAQSGSVAGGASRVGPVRGAVVELGGGSMGPEIYKTFIEAAGGPDALILSVRNARGADTYPQNAPLTRRWKQAGAKNIYALFTKDRNVANSDSFVAIIKKAGGVWFEGGRQYRLVDAYGGTKRCVAQRAAQPIGLHKTSATADGGVMSNVDELDRVSLGQEVPRTYAGNPTAWPAVEREPIDVTKWWGADTYRGVARYRAFGAAGGKRNAFVRIAERRVTIIILTSEAAADAGNMADQIAARLVGSS